MVAPFPNFPSDSITLVFLAHINDTRTKQLAESIIMSFYKHHSLAYGHTLSSLISQGLPAVGDGVLEVPLRVGGLSISNRRLDAGRMTNVHGYPGVNKQTNKQTNNLTTVNINTITLFS